MVFAMPLQAMVKAKNSSNSLGRQAAISTRITHKFCYRPINNDTGEVVISAFGRAIGHYARWVKPGARRIGATTDDPLVQASSFLNETDGIAAFVVLNNAAQPRAVSVQFRGAQFAGAVTGEQSTAAAYWQTLLGLALNNATNLTINLPSHSVTSLAVSYLVPPQLNLPWLTPTELRFALIGGIGQSYIVETSTDLVAWSVSQAITLTNLANELTLPRADGPMRFIRARTNR